MIAAPESVPVVSVVVIFRDAVDFIREAIESVLAQSFGDWELILVDDGSRDGSESIAREYARREPARIRCIAHAGRVNRGTAASRNLGIAEARGSYIAELDADDVWRPAFLQRRVEALSTDPQADLAFGPVLRWYGWSGDPEDAGRDWVATPWAGLGPVIDAPALLPILLEKPQLGGVPKGWVIRSDAIRRVGGYPEEFHHMYEDQALLCMLGIRGRALYLDGCDYLYRRHPGSMVGTLYRTLDRRQMRLTFLEWLEGYLGEVEYRHPAVRRSLRVELRRCRHPRLSRVLDGAAELPARMARKLSRIAGSLRPLEGS